MAKKKIKAKADEILEINPESVVLDSADIVDVEIVEEKPSAEKTSVLIKIFEKGDYQDHPKFAKFKKEGK